VTEEDRKEIAKQESKRTRFERFVELALCSWLGHDRHFNVWAYRYNPRTCKRCRKDMSLW
jgi:hypothetical protein